MLKNYITIALRHLFRHKFFSLINIVCLAIGITFSLIIGVYVLNQYQINASVKNVKNQYVVKSNWKVKEMGLDYTTFGPLPKALREEYPKLIKNYYRYTPVTNVISYGDKHFKEDIAIGDTSIVSMYGFPVLHGNKQRAFPDNNSAVVTETMARKLFGTDDALDKVMTIQSTVKGEQQDYKISAVIKDIPYNSVTGLIDINYQIFVPTEGNRYFTGGDPSVSWSSPFAIGMVELQTGVSPKDLELPLRQLLAKYTPDNVQQNLRVELAPVKDYYLNDHNAAARKMILTLSIAAAFILLMAVINFVNINIGTSAYRLKEIGLRKVFGGLKTQLILQFISEAMILTGIAALLSLGLYQLVRSVFSQVLNAELPSVFHLGGASFLLLLALVVVTGLIAGAYPAFVLASSRVINAVKGKIDTARGGLALRKGMLIVQFTLAIIVFISALTVSRQVAYVFSKDTGYDKEQVMVITAFPKQWDSTGVARMISIKNGLMQVPAVKTASLSFEIPERKPPNSIDMKLINGDDRTVLVPAMGADENYAEAFGLKVLSGACFNQSGGFIPGQVVLNESAVKAFGLTPESAINRQLTIPSAAATLTISGVVKDFNYSSLQNQIEPLAFFHVRDAVAYRYLSLKINTADISATMDRIKSKWKELSPDAPFEYAFMDEKFQSLYRSELQLKKAANIATVLNLIIIFLGIFGIVSFTLTKRTREIAVRKVLGADVKVIILLFVKDYAWLILLANIIAWPLAYLVTNKWLDNYAYRISQDALPYLFVGLFVFIASSALIAIQCFRAGIANPVKSLRTE